MTDKLYDPGKIRSLLSKHGVTLSKSLGQNFLVEPDVCPKMAEQAVLTPEDGLLEIGPGIGVLTAELCGRAKKVVSVELDRRLLPVLRETLARFQNLELVNADILKLDLHGLICEKLAGCKNVSVCANLPYYITSPLIMKLLEDRLPIKQIVVMVQKEAAERLCAPVGSRAAGAVTVAVRYYAEARQIFDVPRAAFFPRPKVDGSVIRLRVLPKPSLDAPDEKFFFRMVRAAFSQRRKTALNSLSSGLGLPRETVERAIKEAGLPPDIRAEKLGMDELGRLAETLSAAKR